MKRILTPALSIFLAIGLISCGDSGDGIVGKTMQNIANESLPGADIVRTECGSCHYLDKTVRKVGPSLMGIYGQAPRTKGIPFEKWDEASLDAWIENPTAVHPETRMKIPGIKDAEKRALIIEYLKQI
ncbi:cytochrome c [Mariprofundus aestuarium]|uniref:Cytochrome c n=1 Tax=Mariprofundus aestuarium TaxID=1921086 RepID=A0A2K8KYL8_MARES|nr:c-type cytochrome [Mariprofundus aestuarium]ATX80067.1 cytochrome c [Mariprofundus aestuarium]